MLAFYPDFPTVFFNKFFAKDQTKAGPFLVVCTRGRITLVDPEQSTDHILWDPYPRIRNRNQNTSLVWTDCQCNFPSGLRKFYSIGNQVPEYGADHRLIGKDNCVSRKIPHNGY